MLDLVLTPGYAVKISDCWFNIEILQKLYGEYSQVVETHTVNFDLFSKFKTSSPTFIWTIL